MRNPLRKKRSRYQRARRAVGELIETRRESRRRRARERERAEEADQIPEHEQAFAGLHWMTAGLFVAAGAETAFGERRGDYRPADAIRWAPLIAAPLAGAAQAARAIWPSRSTREIARVLNTVALGVGAAGLASSVRAALTDDEAWSEGEETRVKPRMPSLAPLAFGAVGLLGLLLDREEREAAGATAAHGSTDVRRRRARLRVRM